MPKQHIKPRLFASEYFEGKLSKPVLWSEHVFRFCEFENIVAEGAHIDSMFYGCRFKNCDWYWGLFNLAIFVQVKFEQCSFRGASCADCRFIECEFIDCKFSQDNLGRECSFPDSIWYACSQRGCTGLEGIV